MTERFALVNIGRLGKAGESSFSTMGIQCATSRIDKGWVPCGTHVTPEQEVWQFFYLPAGTVATDNSDWDDRDKIVGLMREVVPALEATGVNVSLAADVKAALARFEG